MTVTQAHSTAVAVAERYRTLHEDRKWYREWVAKLSHPEWAAEAVENRAAIRELVRIRWMARRAERASRIPVAYLPWLESELRLAHGDA